MSAARQDPKDDTVVFPAASPAAQGSPTSPPTPSLTVPLTVPLLIPAGVTAPENPADARPAVPEASVRVHIETVGGSYPRPELTSAAPGRTVFHGTGSAQMMAAVLRRVARQLDPPWWKWR